MIQTAGYVSPYDRLVQLGYLVSLLPVEAGIDTFRQYDIVYLPVGWADDFSGGDYSEIEAHAADYRTYVSEGGALFVDQPNPFMQPEDSVSPTLLPYPITFYNPYDASDWPPIIVNPYHYITIDLSRDDMPGPADQITEIDPSYEVLVRGQTTNSPSLAVAEYGQGRVVVQADNPSTSSFTPFSDEVYCRMIDWVSSDLDLVNPSVGTFEPNGGSGRVGEWVEFTTTYSDPNGYEDIKWAFFFLDCQPPIASGGLAAAYYQPADLLLLLGGGFCRPGQAKPLMADYVTLDCRDTNVSGEGDTLTINWHACPEQCFDDDCGVNTAYELVIDSAGLRDVGSVGWWTLNPASGPAQDTGPTDKPTEADLERLIEDIKAWQSQLGEPYLPLIQR